MTQCCLLLLILHYKVHYHHTFIYTFSLFVYKVWFWLSVWLICCKTNCVPSNECVGVCTIVLISISGEDGNAVTSCSRAGPDCKRGGVFGGIAWGRQIRKQEWMIVFFERQKSKNEWLSLRHWRTCIWMSWQDGSGQW